MTNEERIAKLEAEIKELKAQMELHWDNDLKKQQEIKELQEKQYKEVLKKQEDGFYQQKLTTMTGFTIAITTFVGIFIVAIKKLKEAKKEVKELLLEK